MSNSSICSPRLRGRSTSAAPCKRSRKRCWTDSTDAPSSTVKSTMSSFPSLPKVRCAAGKSMRAKLPPKTVAVPCSLSSARTVNSRFPSLVRTLTVEPTGNLSRRENDSVIAMEPGRAIKSKAWSKACSASANWCPRIAESVRKSTPYTNNRSPGIPATGRNPSTAAAASRTPRVSRMIGNNDSAIPLSPLATCNTALPAI